VLKSMMTTALLDRIVDQPHAVALLRRALDTGRVAHAYAFVGSEGSGRTATALAFAQAMLCERPRAAGPDEPHGGACCGCRSCRMVEARTHPDLHVIVPTPPASNPKGARAIRIDAVRKLEQQAALRPVMGARKVFIVDDADRMTGESPEAFLKTLEEPPDRTVLILVLARSRAVPATVLSRCQLIRFAGREPTGEDAAERSAVRQEAAALIEEARTRGIESILARGDRVERERAEALVDAWWLWCRDVLITRAGAPPDLLTDAARATDFAREAERWSLDDVLAAIDLCRKAREGLASNVTPRLTLEVVLSRLALQAA
jgi:DNA polymerase III subunit delta'